MAETAIATLAKIECPLCETGQIEPVPRLSPYRQKLVHEMVYGEHPSQAQASYAAGYTRRSSGHQAIQKRDVKAALAIAERDKRDKALGLGKKGRQLIEDGLKDATTLPADVKVGMGIKLVEIAEKHGETEHTTDLDHADLDRKVRRAYRAGIMQQRLNPSKADLHLEALDRLLFGAKVPLVAATRPVVNTSPPVSV